MRKIGFLVAGTASGEGKTTLTLALLAAMRQRGMVAQPYKCGPDFLDAGHHTRIAGRAARNLDTWMMGRDENVQVMRDGALGADAVVVEGMMGLFDGKGGDSDEGSSAEIAKLLRLPVVLVVDASRSARSVAAVVLGFESFDEELPLAGVVLNGVGGEGHFRMLEAAIVSRCRTPVLGWMPRDAGLAIAERHLGLKTAEEMGDVEEQRARLCGLTARLDLERIFGMQCGLDFEEVVPGKRVAAVRIGVAYDRAFTFYYEDNLDLLRQAGAEIVEFSPMQDGGLPAGLDALYFGGGYPELYTAELAANELMLESVREFAATGRPVYAECGGMMYLGRSLQTLDGVRHRMAGVLPLDVAMTAGLVGFGYVTVEVTKDCLIGNAGTRMRGQCFHCSRILDAEGVSRCYRVGYTLSGVEEMEGFTTAAGNVLGSYVHVMFRGNPAMVAHLIASARA